MPANNHDQAFLDILNLLTMDQLKPRFKSCPAAGTAPSRKPPLSSRTRWAILVMGFLMAWASSSTSTPSAAGRQYHGRLLQLVGFLEVLDQRQGLQGFSQAHVVGQNAAQAVAM